MKQLCDSGRIIVCACGIFEIPSEDARNSFDGTELSHYSHEQDRAVLRF